MEDLKNIDLDYIMEVERLYTEHLERTEKRGISWGELAYIQGLDKKELDSLYQELLYQQLVDQEVLPF